MRFWDREKEVKDLKAHIQSEPNSMLFVYGPKSSGKSTLLDYVIKEIKKEKRNVFFRKYQIYWFDLRGKFVSNYERVIELFFSKRKKNQRKSKTSSIDVQEPIFKSFKVSSSVHKEIKSRELDPFEYMEEEIKKSGRKTVIVFDELQKLKEIYINGERKFVSELFNFFVRLTKVLHLAHVIVMTSDTFFIEEVYTSSSLKNTSIYYLIDYFDDETAKMILIEEGLSEEDAQYVVNMAGGVPWVMAEVLSGGNPKEKVDAIYEQVISRVFESIRGRDELKELLKRVLNKENLYYEEKRINQVKELVEKEVLFFDPINKIVRFQTKLDERAARELLKD